MYLNSVPINILCREKTIEPQRHREKQSYTTVLFSATRALNNETEILPIKKYVLKLYANQCSL